MRAGSQARGARPGRKAARAVARLPSCRRARQFGAAFQVQGATAAGNYVGKWGAAEELALSGKKSGRAGRSPFQLLADYADQNDARAGALFAEFAGVFKGRRQLVWSPGLKKLAGIDEVSDEQAAEDAVRMADESKHDEQVGHFTPKGWSVVRRHRAALLKFAELAGAAGVDAVVQASKPPSSPSHWQAWGGCLRGRSGRARATEPGVWGSMHPSGGRPRRGPEASPEGLREGERGYNLLYPVVKYTCFSKQVLDHPQ